ncbi:glycine betaine ABC transporter substrate-binding protein, partial [Bacillus pumilus]|uniref:glycine betaine ABC transporter substrate-binding protein n=1 Tax=Bacillus pumilus TaxID=1408 RepID=UPI0034D96AB1
MRLLYDALRNQKIHILLPYSTHPPIKPYHLKILKHHNPFFPPYHPSPLLPQKLLKHNPPLHNLINTLIPKIDTQQIQDFNYQLDRQLQQPP